MRLLAKATASWLKARHFLLRTLNGERIPRIVKEEEEHQQQSHDAIMSDTEDKNHLPHQVHHDYTVRGLARRCRCQVSIVRKPSTSCTRGGLSSPPALLFLPPFSANPEEEGYRFVFSVVDSSTPRPPIRCPLYSLRVGSEQCNPQHDVLEQDHEDEKQRQGFFRCLNNYDWFARILSLSHQRPPPKLRSTDRQA
jgi:hypothetical protein